MWVLFLFAKKILVALGVFLLVKSSWFSIATLYIGEKFLVVLRTFFICEKILVAA